MFKYSKSLTMAVVGTAIALGSVAAPGASAPAEAKKIGFFKHGYKAWPYFVGTGVLLAGSGYYYSSYHSCHWMKVRAIRLDSQYWWDRYHACRGD